MEWVWSVCGGVVCTVRPSAGVGGPFAFTTTLLSLLTVVGSFFAAFTPPAPFASAPRLLHEELALLRRPTFL